MQEFRVGARAIGFGVMLIVGGIGSIVAAISFGAVPLGLTGGLFVAVGTAALIWCSTSAVLLEPEGVAIKSWGQIRRRYAWDSITSLGEYDYDLHYRTPGNPRTAYVLRAGKERFRLDVYRDLDELADEIARRAPNLQRKP